MPKQKSTITLCCWLCALLAAALAIHFSQPCALAADQQPEKPAAETKTQAFGKSHLPLILEEDFEGNAERWEPTDAKAWKLAKIGDNQVYTLFQQSDYKPEFRSPLNFALLKDTNLAALQLDIRALSTGRDYGHRDLCLIFGYQSSKQFYYVHLARNADDHANQIFIVNSAARKKISVTTTSGTKWDDAWHEVRLVRDPGDGTIAVFFDDFTTPAMTASDKTFLWGRVGIGSFDDTGSFDELRLFGEIAQPPTP
jgi:hypothetical protein